MSQAKQSQKYDEAQVRDVVKHYSLEQQERMFYILDHYYFDSQQECWIKKE